ncbi:MAG: nitroreductase family deazaflavin-dependent oxidoreductase [Chloroflexi bacterium]|nr:nitroreductase family deazaflavin-dependent oxidoreductase [Chloroflexota bacterium]
MTDPVPTGRSLDPVAEDLAAWGRVAVLAIPGRRSGVVRRTPVGFLEQPDGSLHVAASTPHTAWALDLLAAGSCEVTIGTRTGLYDATPLDDAALATTVVELILRYGTPAESLGGGPAFRLIPRTGGIPA